MKDIKVIQYEYVRDLYQKIIRYSGRLFKQNEVDQLTTEIIQNTSQEPLSGHYRVEPNSLLDLNSLNAELGLISVDSNSIIEYLSQVQYRLREIKFIAETYNKYAENITNRLMRKITTYNSGKFTQGLTRELDLHEICDEKNTTVVINNNIATMPVINNPANVKPISARDIVISRIGPQYLTKIEGDPMCLFNNSTQGLKLQLIPSDTRYQTAGYQITLNTLAYNVNTIFLRLVEPIEGLNIEIQVSDNKNQNTTIYNKVINTNVIECKFQARDITKLIINLTLSLPNKSLNGTRFYEFFLYSIRMLSTASETTCQFVSKAIELEDNTKSLELVSEYEKTGNSNIKFYISTKEDTEGNPTDYVEIEEKNIINLATRKNELTISPPDKKWNLKKCVETGRRLYNIFDYTSSEDFGDFAIENGTIVAPENVQIIQESIKLYCAINNYKIVTSDHSVEYNIDPIRYTTVYNDSSKWINTLPLRFRVENEPVTENQISYNASENKSTITVRYQIVEDNRNEIALFDQTNTKIDITITDITNKQITVNGKIAIDNKTQLYCTYITTLGDYVYPDRNIEIDTTSIEVISAGNTLVYGSDYRIINSANLFDIEILSSGLYNSLLETETRDDNSIVNHSPDIIIRYKFKRYGVAKNKYYETNILCHTYTDIQILPFTNKEIMSGNFHIINGVNVSSENKYILNPGWNNIKTTQPYPTLFQDSSDVNHYTNEPSAAGLILPSGNVEIRPYIDSMRQVSSFILATMNSESRECFAFENNKIYINFIPEFLDAELLNLPHYVNKTGQYYLCKRALYSSDLKNIGYDTVPESYKIEFNYKLNNEIKKIYIKFIMNNDPKGGTIRLHRLGINAYNEEVI